jgi:hypothetical protein
MCRAGPVAKNAVTNTTTVKITIPYRVYLKARCAGFCFLNVMASYQDEKCPTVPNDPPRQPMRPPRRVSRHLRRQPGVIAQIPEGANEARFLAEWDGERRLSQRIVEMARKNPDPLDVLEALQMYTGFCLCQHETLNCTGKLHAAVHRWFDWVREIAFLIEHHTQIQQIDAARECLAGNCVVDDG